MVQNSAPNSRYEADNASPIGSSPANWTNRFAKSSVSRLHRKVSLLTLASSALFLSGSLSRRSEANPPGLSPVWVADSASRGVSTPIQPATVATENSLVAPSTVAVSTPAVAPSPALSPSKQPSTILQIDASGTISAKPFAPQISSESSSQSPSTPPVLSQSAIPSAPLVLASEISPSSLSSSQLQLQPIAAPVGARGPVSKVEKAAKLAFPVASRPLAATRIVEIAEKVASRPTELEVQPKIRISAIVSGQEQQAQIAVTPKMTVGQALAAMGVSLAVLDRVTPDVSALARDGLSVRITRIGSQIRTSRKPIPAELRYQPTTKIPSGAKATIQQPKAGTLQITERVWTRDSKVTKREFISQRITAQPKPKIIALGVTSRLMPNNVRPHPRYARALSYRGGSPRDRMLAPADPRTFAPVQTMTVLATGYSAGPAGGAIGDWTATGVKCTYGAVAVDPRLIPLGSKLYIEGYGYGFACDVGGAIKGKHIDLAFNSPSAAFAHGKKKVKIWILGR